MSTTMTVKEYVTTPKKTREVLRLSPRDDVDFAVDREGRVLVQRAVTRDKVLTGRTRLI